MATLLKRDENCTRCKLNETAEYVCLLGAGPEPCDVMVIGEAPGEREDDSGIPFVGRAGKLLDQLFEEAGLSRRKMFITNAVSCRPPGNRTPTKREIAACNHWLSYQIRKVKPKYVLLLGNTALAAVLDQKGVTQLRGKPIERDGVIYFPAFHPSFVLRDEKVNRPFLLTDLRHFKRILDHGGIPKEAGSNLIRVTNLDLVDEMIENLIGNVSFDIETSCLYPWATSTDSKFYSKAVITSLGFGTRTAQYTIPMNHFEVNPFSQSTQQKIVEKINKKILDCIVTTHFGKFDILWMKVIHGMDWKIDFDCGLAHYVLDENSRHGLKYLSQVYFGAMPYDLDPTKANWKDLSTYHGYDLLYTRKLKPIFSKMLFQDGGVKRVFDEILMPLINIFRDIEYNGVFVNQDKFEEAEEYLRAEIKKATKELSKYGEDVNWRSTQQLAKVLFTDLHIKPIEKTKKGAYSTNESVLKRINHPISSSLLRLRGANQQLSFFIQGWKPFLVDGRLHPSFKLHGAVTGRPSCEHPNLQQVPRDSLIRSLITAPPGWEFVEFDLSQMELRIAAELANEKNMLYCFLNGIDIHWKTAIREIARGHGLPQLVTRTACYLANKKSITYAQAISVLENSDFKKALEFDPAWKEFRKKAKAVNFGFLYEMREKKFIIYARDNYGVTVNLKQAKESRNAYFDLYPGLLPWHERQKHFARLNGYVLTLTGRKRRLPKAQCHCNQCQSGYSCMDRHEAERQAINSPVQGFCSDWNMICARQVHEQFKHKVVRVVGTIHDSVVTWIRTEEIEELVPAILEIMRKPALIDKFGIKMRVPIEAEASIGPWSQGKELEKWLSSR